MARKSKKAIQIDKGLVIVASTEEQKKYASAIPLVREMVEVLAGRNFENFDVSEIIKLRPIILELTKVLADKGVNPLNWGDHKEFLEDLHKPVMEKLRAIDMLRVDLI